MILLNRIIKRNVLILSMLMLVFSVNAQNAYVTNHKTIATVLSEHYGIPVSVILAVAVVESSAGRGATAKVLNNHFGIVGNNSYVNDRGHKSRYKEYSSELASYLDFCKLISHKKFYARLKNSDNCTAWVKAISHSGYSEDPQLWEKRILSTIRANRL